MEIKILLRFKTLGIIIDSIQPWLRRIEIRVSWRSLQSL